MRCIHHKDGNPYNNSPENLLIVEPKCEPIKRPHSDSADMRGHQMALYVAGASAQPGSPNFEGGAAYEDYQVHSAPWLAQDAASLLERVKNYYSFECEGGPLRMCRDFTAVQRQIALAVTAIDKVLKEFDIAGKPQGYICRTDLQIARAALVGNPDYRATEGEAP